MKQSRFFRHLNPAARKPNPEALAHYMRGVVKRSKYILLPLIPLKAVPAAWATNRGYFCWGSARKGFVAEDFGGVVPILSRALARRQRISSLCPPGLWALSLDCLSCFLDSGWRRWETPLLVLLRPWQVCCVGAGRPSLYVEAAPFGVSPALARGTEALSFIWRASFGVCGLLAAPKIHQIFGDNPVKFPRCTRDKAWIFSS